MNSFAFIVSRNNCKIFISDSSSIATTNVIATTPISPPTSKCNKNYNSTSTCVSIAIHNKCDNLIDVGLNNCVFVVCSNVLIN